MLKNIKKKNEGFTIIEVLIVLAIAGLIMLIVFLAVPALQRSSRNTGRKNDVSRVLTAVNEWVSNNSGSTFATGDPVTAVIDSVGATGQYTLNSSNLTVKDGSTAAQTAMQTIAKIQVVTSAKCGASGATVVGTSRQIAIQYALETSGSSPTTGQAACLDS
jgi:prepilin-type N-terminal cleavage/methylation domain-containing protein